MSRLEEKAIQFSKDSNVKKKLLQARVCLNDHLKEKFRNYTWDKTNKRLISNCEKYVLQWKLRLKPNEPESYENQQTSEGIVTLNRIYKMSHEITEIS